MPKTEDFDKFPTTQPGGAWETILQFFPVDLWGQIIVVAVAVLFITQFIKVTFKVVNCLPRLSPDQVVFSAALSAWPLAFSVLKLMNDAISDWLLAAPVAIIGWGIAWTVAEFGFKVLYWWKPKLARALNADPDRRFRNKGRPGRGRYERRQGS